MAEITDTLRLDIDQALRDVQRVEQALDRALAPVELRVDDSSIRRVEDSLERVESAARETTGQVRLTADEYREVARAVELGVDPARAIARATGEVREQANLAEADFRDLARALDISEDSARDLAREILDAQQAAQRLEDAARDVARQLDLSEDQADQLARGLGRADRAASDINTRTGTLVGTFGSLRGAAAGVAGVLATIGIGQGIALAARGATAAVGQFQALNESINAVKVTFDEASTQIFEFGDISARAAGLSAQAFQQAVVPIGAVLRNFGLDANEAADASIILVQRAADLASVFNVDVNDALLAINSALVGQVEPLRRFGAEISVARVEAFLLASGMVASKNEIDQAALVQGRLALILQDTNRAAGDFVNTSGEFANASRIARAEVDELSASAGEALLPAFEALLAAIPGLVAGLETGLVPALADAAQQVAALIGSIQAGAGDSFADETVAVITGLGSAFDGLKAPIDAAAIATGLFFGNFDQVNQGIDQLSQRIDNQFIRGSLNRLIGRMQEGITTADAFADEITSIGVRNDGLRLLEQGFDRLVGTAGLSGDALEDVLQGLIDTGVEAGLTADVMTFLALQLAIVANTLRPVGNEAAQADRAMGELGGNLSAAASRFTVFAGDLETARTNITTTLRELADDSAGQQERLAEALDPFADLPKQIELSAAEATAAIVAQFEAIAAFEANIARLAAEAPELARDLFSKGPAAADLVEDFLDSPALIVEAENALRGVATAGVLALTDELETELVAAGLDQSTAADFAAIFSNPNIIREVTDAGIQAGASGVGGYRQGLLDEAAAVEIDARTAISAHTSAIFAQEQITEEAGTSTAESFFDSIVNFDPLGKLEALFGDLGIEVDLTDEGTEAGLSLMFGIQEAIASRTDAIGDAVENATRNALQMQSPSRLMLDLGREAADSFATGFEQVNLQLRTPAQPITGSIATAATGQVAGGVNVNLNINNPSVNDAVSDAARLGQIASSIATTYRSVT